MAGVTHGGAVNRLSITLIILAVTATIYLGNSDASAQDLPFFTVSEYVSHHPAQARLAANFNALVSSPAHRISLDKNKEVRIAVIYPGKQVSDYWRRSVDSFKMRMAESGIAFIVDEYYSTPGDEQKVQERQIRQALKNDPDYLVFTLDVFRHKRIIDDIVSSGRPKIILQNITTPLRDWEGRQPFMYVGFDHTIGARLLADYFIDKTGGSGTYGMLYFTHGYVSTMRGDIFNTYVSQRSQLREIDTAFTNGKEDVAEKAAARMIKHKGIKFLYACATDTALGAVRAIKAAGLSGKVLINGWGGGSAELDAILAGDLDVTVMRMNDDNGVAMAEGIRLDMEGKGDSVPLIYSGEMVLVEKGISRADLEALEKKAFRYSGQ